MTYFEWWIGDEYREIVDEQELHELLETHPGSSFKQLNNLP